MTEAQEVFRALKSTGKKIEALYARRSAWSDMESSIQTVFHTYRRSPTDETKADLLAVIETHHAMLDEGKDTTEEVRTLSRREYKLADELCRQLAPVWFPPADETTNVKVGVFRQAIATAEIAIRCAKSPADLIEEMTELRAYSCRAAKATDERSYNAAFEQAVYRLIDMGAAIADDDQPILPQAE